MNDKKDKVERLDRDENPKIDEKVGKQNNKNLTEKENSPDKMWNEFAFKGPAKIGLLEAVTEELTNRLFRIVTGENEGQADETILPFQPLQILKEDEESVRDTKWYQALFRSARWQRDSYLIGGEHAEQRKTERERGIIQPPSFTQVSYDATALGNIHLERLGQWFIPSATVHRTCLPIVLGLPGGPLYKSALGVTSSLIPISQPQMDAVMKSTIVWMLQDDYWKRFMKSSTNTHIASTFRDAPP